MTAPKSAPKLRVCKACDIEKPLKEFPLAGGYRKHTCKLCMQPVRAKQRERETTATSTRKQIVVTTETIALLSSTWLMPVVALPMPEDDTVRQHVCADDDGDEESQARWAARRQTQRDRYQRNREPILKRARGRYQTLKQQRAGA